ncbi:MAG: serine/threonine-protein kinase, partial [Gemmataceae bacterium]
RLLAQLNHPHIVRVWDFEDDPALPYLVMEFVEGQSLAELLQQSGRLRPERAVQVVGHIADALAAAHRLGVVHRDVKPGNILLTPEGTAKLADLGLAVSLDTDRNGHGLAGTVAYMSPEQATRPAAIDHRSDIYSLGATFYHLLTGQIPFQGSSRMEVILKHAKESPVPAHELVPELPPLASEVIDRMMAKSQADRYPTYDDLLLDLHRLHGMLTPGSTRPTGSGTFRMPLPDGLGGDGR